MATTSKVTIKTVVKGTLEGVSAQGEYVMVNTTGCRVIVETTFGAGVANATTFASPPTARFMQVTMPTSNTNPWRLTGSTAEVGLALSSQGTLVYALDESTAGTTFYGYTSSTRAISGVRITYS